MSESDLENDSNVRLYVYDLSRGLARIMSDSLLGKHIDGVWHTGIVCYGREYYFGSNGIESCRPSGTVLGEPEKIIDLGSTQIPYSLFLEYMFGLGESTYKPGTYHLFNHNCNNFSQEMVVFLTGKSIPEYVTNLPQEILNTPLGQSLQGLVESVSLRAEGSRGLTFGRQAAEEAQRRYSEGFLETPLRDPDEDKEYWEIMETVDKVKEEAEASKAAKSEGEAQQPNKDGDKKQNGEVSPEDIPQITPWEERLAAKRAMKNKEPPIVYQNIDATAVYGLLEKHVMDILNEDEKQSLHELYEFVITDSGAWALGGQHLQFITRILTDTTLPSEARKSMLQFLQAAALKEDVILLLHMDRREHLLMNYINDFEKIDADEQEEVAKLISNLCLPYSSSDWLLYISEWQIGNQSCSNSKVTTRVAVNSLLSNRPSLQEKGIALMYNLGLKEVFDDTATELASAILQFLNGEVPEEQAFQLLTALLRFMHISYKDVPALIKMMGPDIGKFKGKSDRLDHLVEQVTFKVSTVGGEF